MPPSSSSQDLIVFDGHCVFCSGFAHFITRHDKAKRFRFVTAQSPTGRALYERFKLDPDLMETNIVIIDGVAHTKMRSFTAAMKQLGWPWRAFVVLNWPPAALMNAIYDVVAQNRYRLGRRTCPAPSPELKARLIE